MLTGTQLVERLSDPEKYEVYDHVAVLDEHEIKDDDGKVTDRVDREKLEEIAANNNDLIEKRGTACPVVIGHTKEKDRNGEKPDEKDQPEVVGFATSFRVDNLPDEEGSAIFCKFHIYKQDAERVEQKYPYRSVELWTGDRWSFHPISVLGATAPERNMGMLIKHARKYYYSREANRFVKRRKLTLLCERPLQSIPRKRKDTGAIKMGRNMADEYGRAIDGEDLTDLPPDQIKMINLLLKTLEKSPMWKFYEEASKAQKEADAQAAMPAPPPAAMQGPPPAPMQGDPNQPPPQDGPPPSSGPPGADMAQNDQPGTLTPEEEQELMALLNRPSQGQMPQGQAPQQMSRKGGAKKKEMPNKKTCGTSPAYQSPKDAGKQDSDDDSDDGESSAPMSRKPKKRKQYEEPDEIYENEEDEHHGGAEDDGLAENGHGQWQGTEESDDGSEGDLSGPEEDSDEYGGGIEGEAQEDGDSDGEDRGDEDDPLGSEDSPDTDGQLTGPGPDDDNQDSDDQDEQEEGPVDDELPEWEDEEPEMKMKRPGKPKKKSAMPGPTNGFVPGGGMPRPNQKGKPRLDKMVHEKKQPGTRSPDANGKAKRMSRSNAPSAPKVAAPLSPINKRLRDLERMVRDLSAQNEALRTKERYSRRENTFGKLINEGFEIDDPRAEFEQWKDVPEEIFNKYVSSVRKYSRQNADPTRVAFFDTAESESSVLDRTREMSSQDSRNIGDIMKKESCDYPTAVKKYNRRS